MLNTPIFSLRPLVATIQVHLAVDLVKEPSSVQDQELESGHSLGQTRLHRWLGQHWVGRKTKVSLEPLRPNRDQYGVLV